MDTVKSLSVLALLIILLYGPSIARNSYAADQSSQTADSSITTTTGTMDITGLINKARSVRRSEHSGLFEITDQIQSYIPSGTNADDVLSALQATKFRISSVPPKAISDKQADKAYMAILKISPLWERILYLGFGYELKVNVYLSDESVIAIRAYIILRAI